MRWQAFKDLLKHYRAVFQAAWSQRKQTDFTEHLSHETEFLPAALSLQETPLSPKPRYAMWLIIAFATIALLWAIFGHIDVVATGQGKVIPNGYSKVIQPLEAATVKTIYVTDGQAVKAGDVLLELDPTAIDADLVRAQQDLRFANLQVERANALLNAIDSNQRPMLKRPEGIDDIDYLEAKNLLDAQFTQFNTQLNQVADEIKGYSVSMSASRAQAAQLNQAVNMAARRSQDYKRLAKEGFISEHAYMDREQARIEQQSDLTAAQGQDKQMQAAIARTIGKREEIISTTRKTALESLNDGMQKKSFAEQTLAKAELRKTQATMTSPVDGSVQQLVVHTVGGVVTPAQALMVIVPTDKPLDVEVFLPNKDIGFVKVGQSVQVKVEAFPYTKHGVIRGTVASLSSDAIVDDKLGLVYSAKISINPEQDKDSASIKLSPGLAVTAEIKTDRRRVIDYFLSPLMEYQSESMKER